MTSSKLSHYLPTMTQDYSQISDTARAVDYIVLPKIASYIRRITPQIANMHSEKSFVIADYGAADGVNSSELFKTIIELLHAVNPSLRIKLIYIDIADSVYFDKFWAVSKLAKFKHVESEYVKRSFYEPFPELIEKINIGFSSTSLHWLDTKTVTSEFFQHPDCIQANQLTNVRRKRFVEKWRRDWRIFFRDRSAELVEGGALFMANLTNLGRDRWPASPGYNNLRDICCELFHEGKISKAELKAIFIPDYFATPDEIKALLEEDNIEQFFLIKSFGEMTVPCAYFTKAQSKLGNPQERVQLAVTLAHVVRAWSESSIKTGLSSDDKEKIEEIYKRLKDKFYNTPQGLPYQYCLIELIKRDKTAK